ncbi:receptor-like protein 14 isoform X3 [Magnolia sinica]|uniref:receptor-like protein 14 isoform X3 n=1 Tax=Magnolia sinica TaxID=86752 RepID=UPI002658EA7B|nr:receptor-like protein 14 isoform X3 [Magnolia sinica]
MDWALVMWLWALLYVQYCSDGCLGCLDKERTSLLEIKASINYPNGSYLLTWEDGTDCCSWERIKCNNGTGRLTEISLSETREYELGEWYLNADLLLSFGELQSLDLSRNNLAGWVDHEGFKRWSRLSKLEHLDLTYNLFNESILPYLGSLSSLKSLSLKGNYFGLLHTGVDVEYSPLGILYTSFEMLSRLGNLEQLDLSWNQLNRSILPYLGALSSLKSLDLSWNNLEGCFPSKGFKRWSRLSKLEHLDLSYNSFNESILPYLGSLSSLKSLSLGDNQFGFPHSSLDVMGNSPPIILYTSFEMLSRLGNLEQLDLSWNQLNRSILPYLGALSSLKSLDLSWNNLEGCFPSKELANLSKLEVLELGHNRLNGSLLLQDLCNLENLQELDLQGNELEGSLPPCLSNLSSLQLLDLSENRLSGQISSSLISSLTMIRFLSLSYNRFEGSLSFSSFANLSKLEVVELSVLNGTHPDGDVITYPNQLEVETESTPWVPKFQLEVLHLSNCNINKLTGTIPTFLSSQYDLVALDLSHNNMKGNFPSWLLENNKRLGMLDLGSNSLAGPFHLPPHSNNLIALFLDVSSNHISGQLPENIGLCLPNLIYLNMSINALSGSIPLSMGNMSELVSLDLSRNNFSGEIPEQLAMGCISLEILKLSNNRFQGAVFPTHSNLTLLEYLYLDGNQFTGRISAGIFNSPLLQFLDVGKNNISGRLPAQIGNFSELEWLSMPGNYLEGPIPTEYCKLSRLSFLDLSQNGIFGPIPSCFSLSLKFLHLQGNELTGLMPTALSKISSLVTLDVSDNYFSGNIPNWIGTLQNLRFLLGGNNLQGHIPMQLCQLKNVSILDISHNNLSGPIPMCFGNMTFGRARVTDFSTFVFYPWSTTFDQHIELPGYRIEVSVPLIHGRMTKSEEEVEFITKKRSETYKGDVLYLMSGVDLSWNQLTGEIPPEIGYLTATHALNLSHNQLSGPIPETFSNLKQIESLDLSHNRLSGEIPPQLTELYTLSTFTVAYNNLSGVLPDMMKGQFSTFGETSYEGNPLLCGLPLKSCFSTSPLPPSMPTTSGDKDDGNDIIFYACFWVSCTMSFLLFIALLYINCYWRGLYFYFVDACIDSCYYFALDSYYFALDNLRKVFTRPRA